MFIPFLAAASVATCKVQLFRRAFGLANSRSRFQRATPDLTETEADAPENAFVLRADRQAPTLSVAIRRNLSLAPTALVRNLRGLSYLSGPAVTVMQTTKPGNGLGPQSAPCKGNVAGSISVVNRRLPEICTMWSGVL